MPLRLWLAQKDLRKLLRDLVAGPHLRKRLPAIDRLIDHPAAIGNEPAKPGFEDAFGVLPGEPGPKQRLVELVDDDGNLGFLLRLGGDGVR